MLTTRPTPVLETTARRPRPGVRCPDASPMLCFDDPSAVMYRKIIASPLSATFPSIQHRTGLTAGLWLGPWGVSLGCARGDVASRIIPSRMTHRPLFDPQAGAPSERINP